MTDQTVSMPHSLAKCTGRKENKKQRNRDKSIMFYSLKKLRQDMREQKAKAHVKNSNSQIIPTP